MSDTGYRMSDNGYHKLDVYKRAHALAVRVHRMTLGLPPIERYEEGSQVRRSSKRVSASIVEGYACRHHKGLFLSYLGRALGSSDETQEHLRFLIETGSSTDNGEARTLLEAYEELSRKLARFVRSVERGHQVSWCGIGSEDTRPAPEIPQDPADELLASVSEIRHPTSDIRGSGHGRKHR